MKLATSNIGWPGELIDEVKKVMNENDYAGIEIAPSMAFSKCYETEDTEINDFLNNNKEICSMQSLLYGYQGEIFESEESVNKGIEKMKTVIEFAEKINCRNLVFGSPKNRNVNNEEELERSKYFFKALGEYAKEHNTCVALEANPPIYNTNFINGTFDALNYVKEIDSDGLKINLDLGTVINNNEDLKDIINEDNMKYINHVHISEPFLAPIDENHKEIHKELFSLLKYNNYNRFVSIEMKMDDSILDKIVYIREVVNETI